MMNSSSRRVHELFVQAIELAPAERLRFLQGTAAEADVLGEVNSLLRAHESAGRFLADPAVSLGEAGPAGVAAGSLIGPYRVVRLIGEGGYGSVFLAEQEQPIRRSVALKVIRPGMDLGQVVARFNAEREVLALMDHPNIARVLDAGVHEGSPFVVMELVEGPAITAYCQKSGASLTERVHLMIAVCKAVQHAHQKGIIHRDLKPSNVLVAMVDGRPVPKVIDFGIAKAVGGLRLTSGVTTQFRQLIGTPQYMSPEQAECDMNKVDTRSDVYALGAVLYEMLTGQAPFDPAAFTDCGYEKMLRTLRDTPVPPPSRRMNGDPAARRVRGDLDWIVLKAMEKERDRRYETAEAMAEDLARYLEGRAVMAGPASRAYRLRRAMRRHYRLIATAAVMLIALMGGAAMATAGMVQARHERDRARLAEAAERQQRQEAQRLQKVAQERADEIQGAQYLLYHILAPRPASMPSKEMLDLVAARMDDGTVLVRPRVAAPVRTALGNSYLSLGALPQASRQYMLALDADRAYLPAGDLEIASGANNLGVSLIWQARPLDAEPYFRQSLAIYRAARPPQVTSQLSVLRNLATVDLYKGDLDEAEMLLREFQELARAHSIAGDPLEAAGKLLGALREPEKIEAMRAAAVEMRRRLKLNDPDVNAP